MSDDDEYVEDDVAEDYQNNERVYHVLRDFCDVPKLDMQSTTGLLLPRHGKLKKVVVLATFYHVYLFKKKGLKLYMRWSSQHLTVCRRGASVYFSLGIAADSIADEHEKFLKGATSRSQRRKHSDSDESDDEGGANSLDENQENDTFSSCRIVCASDAAARELCGHVANVVFKATSLAAKHRREEEGKVKLSKVVIKDADDDDEPKHDDFYEDDDEDDDDAGVDDAQVVFTRATAALQQASSNATSMLRNAPGRYIAVASLVDGEFADYTALKNAYLRNEDGTLLDDLRVFIAENELQVASVCRQHYPSFLHAAKQCATITQTDAEAVRDELSGATKLVRDAALDMKKSASDLLLSKAVCDQMDMTRQQLDKLHATAEILETVESQIAKEQLLGAASSLRTLTPMAAQVAETSIGDYILHRCVPRLHRRIVASATARLNKWLAMLRTQAASIGKECVEQLSARSVGIPRVVTGKMLRRVYVSDERGGSWTMRQEYVPCSIVNAPIIPYGAAAASVGGGGVAPVSSVVVPETIRGATIQQVFAALNLREQFRNAYVTARWKQLQTDLFSQRPKEMELLANSSATVVVDTIAAYCHLLTGTLMLEDIVISASKPFSVHADSDLIRIWEGACRRIAEMVSAAEVNLLRDCGSAITIPGTSANPQTPPASSSVAQLLECFHATTAAVRANLTNASLDRRLMSRVAERLSGRLHSMWVEDCCTECAMAIAMDSFTPIPVANAAEYEAYAGRFFLNRALAQELPVLAAYKAGNITLPYALLVPTIGDRVSTLVSRCYNATVGSEVNNFDDIVLGYQNVVFRAAQSVLQGKIASMPEGSALKLGLLVSSCAAMTVVISFVEMEFVTHCQYGEEGEQGRQELGRPKLLASSAQLFSQLQSFAIDKLNQSLQTEITGMLETMGSLAYWKRRVSARRGGSGSGTPLSGDSKISGAPCLPMLLDFVEKRLQPLKSLLQPTVFQTICSFLLMHAATTVQGNIDRAIDVYHESDDMSLLRDCVTEFRLEVVETFAKWVQQLEKLISGGSSTVAGKQQHALKSPVDFDVVATEFLKLIEAREIEIAREKAARNLLVANLDAARAAGAAVVNGVADVGKATGKTFLRFGKTVKDGVVGSSPQVTPRNGS